MKGRLSIAVGLCALLAPTALGAGPAIPEETVSGRIIDVTCYGPCPKSGFDRKPFAGHADVVVTDRKSGGQIARASVEGSRYSILAPPGRYRIVAIPYPEQDSLCWEGKPRRLKVVAGQPERRRLKVENVCVR